MSNHPPPAGVPNWSARQIVVATLFIVLVLLAFYLLYRFSLVVFILFIAIVLGTAIRPSVDWLNAKGVPRSTGVIIIYLILLGLITGVILLLAPLIADQSTRISSELPQIYSGLRSSLIHSPSQLLVRIGATLPVQWNFLITQSTTPADETVDRVAQSFLYTGLILRGMLTTLAVFLLAFYWTLESERSIRSILMLVPAARRDYMREILASVETKIGGYIRGEAILCLSIGILALASYSILGIRYALVLAIFAGLMEAVPIIGPVIGAIPAVMVALSTSPEKVFWVLISTVVIQALENNWIYPRVMSKSVGVNPIITLLALAAFSSLLGLPGALFAVPFAAIIQHLVDRILIQARSQEHPSLEQIGRDRLSLLRLEAHNLSQDVRKQLRQKEETSDETTDQLEDTIEAIAYELDKMLAQIDINNTEKTA